MLKWIKSGKQQPDAKQPQSHSTTVVEDSADLSVSQDLSLQFNRDDVNLGLILTSGDGKVKAFNQIASQLFNLDDLHDIGIQVTHIIRHPKFVKSFNQQLLFDSFELDNIKVDGTCAEIIFVPQYDNTLLIIARDITERRRLENTSKEIVTNLSHELRTPLTVIRGYMEALHSFDFSKKDERIVEAIDSAKQQCDRMGHLVENALLLGHLEMTDVDENLLEEVDMEQLVHTVANDTKHLYPQRQIKMKLSHQKLRCVPAEAYSLVSNLLSNALRYSDEHSAVEIHWYAEGNKLYLDVIDYGEGIEKQFIPQLTARFFRISKTRSEVTGGNGLGLTIVSNILRRYQAELKVTSKPGEGSTFSCRFNSD